MNILLIFLFCLCLPCIFSYGNEPLEESTATVSFRINLAETTANTIQSNASKEALPDRSTPYGAACLLLRGLQEKTDWTQEPYKELPATSPFVGEIRMKSILTRLEAIQAYVTEAPLERPPFVDKQSITVNGDLAIAYILLPDKTSPYIYAATSVALIKRQNGWKVSLTPGSFDNTFLPFDDKIRKEAEKLSTEAKKNIFTMAQQYSLKAVETALKQIREYRKNTIEGKTDEELINLLICAVKDYDPVRTAALLITPFNKDKIIVQSSRLTPVIKGLRLQDRAKKNGYIQPTNLSFMTFPNTILVPLQPHPTDRMESQEEEADDPNKNYAKDNGKDILSIGALSIVLPRMAMPQMDKPALIYRYTLEKVKDPTDGHPVLRMNMMDAFPSWNIKEDELTTSRIMADFHRTYPPLAFPTPKEAAPIVGKALFTKDSLILLRMLDPNVFSTIPDFEQALTLLKTAITNLHPSSDYLQENQGSELLITSTHTDDNHLSITVKLNLSDGNTRTTELPFIKTKHGWMIDGINKKQSFQKKI